MLAKTFIHKYSHTKVNFQSLVSTFFLQSSKYLTKLIRKQKKPHFRYLDKTHLHGNILPLLMADRY